MSDCTFDLTDNQIKLLKVLYKNKKSNVSVEKLRQIIHTKDDKEINQLKEHRYISVATSIMGTQNPENGDRTPTKILSYKIATAGIAAYEKNFKFTRQQKITNTIAIIALIFSAIAILISLFLLLR